MNFVYFGGLNSSVVLANTRQQQFQDDIDEIKKRIDDVSISLEGVALEKITLQEVIDELNRQITSLQAIITQTQTELNTLNQAISQAQDDIEGLKDILEQILVLLYQRSGASALEIIMTAETFSDYLDDQEYLSRLQIGIDQLTRQIQAIETQLEIDKQKQLSLLEDQQAQEVALTSIRWEQQQLLTTTLNQEQLFQAQLAQLHEDQERLEKELEEYLASLLVSAVNLGPVKAGDIIGKNGNTGWSTGPHLHLAIYSKDNVRYDPLDFLAQYNLYWPMGGSGGWVSQGFHLAHQALDIAAQEGTPIHAIADGHIIHRGCLFGGDYATFGVIIEHDNFISLYIHLQAPNNPQYSECSINRRSSYGTPSIDYTITQ